MNPFPDTSSPVTWIFAFWILTAALGAPLLLGLLLGSRAAAAQRRVVRAVLLLAPAILVAGVLVPDPFEGRPLLRIGSVEPSPDRLARDFAEPSEPDFDEIQALDRRAAAAPRLESREEWPTAEATTQSLTTVPPTVHPERATAFGASAEDLAADLAEEDWIESATPFFLSSDPLPSDNFDGDSADGDSADGTDSSRAGGPRTEANGAIPGSGEPGLAPAVDPSVDPSVEASVEEAPHDTATPGEKIEKRSARRSLTRELAFGPELMPLPSPREGTPVALAPIRHPTALHAPSPSALEHDRPWEPRRAAVQTDFRGGPIGGGGSSDALDLSSIGAALLFIWLIGVIVGWLRVGSSLWLLSRWRRTSSALGNTRGVPNIDPTAAPLPVRIIPGLGSAAAVGILTPEIWLPAHWSARLDRASLHALLGHEAAHHNGRDPLWRALSAIVSSLLWPHPLVHSLRRREELLSELEADRLVLAAGAGRRRYAELLANLAAEASGAPTPLAAGVLGTRSPLERRIRMILSTSSPRSHRSAGWVTPAFLGSLCAGVIGLSAWFPLVGNACDPAEKEAQKVEVVLEECDGEWHAIARDAKGALKWRLAISPTDDGPATLAGRDGRYAKVSIGDRLLLVDTADGRLIEPKRAQIPIRRDDALLQFLSNGQERDENEAAPWPRFDPDRRALEIHEHETRLRALEIELERVQIQLQQRLMELENESQHQRHSIESERAGHFNELAMQLAELNRARLSSLDLDASEQERVQRALAEREAELEATRSVLDADFQARLAELSHRSLDERTQLESEFLQRRKSHLAELARARESLASGERALLEGRLAQARKNFQGARDFTDEHEHKHRQEHLREHEHGRAHDHADHADHDHDHQDGADDGDGRDEFFGDRQRASFDAERRALREALQHLERQFGEERDQFEDMPEFLEAMRESFEDLEKELENALEGLEEGLESVEEQIEEAVEELPELLAGLEELPELLEMLSELPRQLEGRDRSREAIQDLRRELDEERDRRRGLEEENKGLRKIIKELEKKLKKSDSEI